MNRIKVRRIFCKILLTFNYGFCSCMVRILIIWKMRLDGPILHQERKDRYRGWQLVVCKWRQLGVINKRFLIGFYCLYPQHGRRVFVIWISRDWLQTSNSSITVNSSIACDITFEQDPYFRLARFAAQEPDVKVTGCHINKKTYFYAFKNKPLNCTKNIVIT